MIEQPIVSRSRLNRTKNEKSIAYAKLCELLNFIIHISAIYAAGQIRTGAACQIHTKKVQIGRTRLLTA